MARREAATRRGRFKASTEDKPTNVRMPGSRVQMLGPVAIGAPSSPQQMAPRREDGVARLDHMPVKK